MCKKKTTKEFKEEMLNINPDIEILGEYINNKIKIKCKCKIDGYEWETTPNNLISNHGCPKCCGHTRETHNEFVEELKNINPNIEIIEKYKGKKVSTKFKCKIDNYIWTTEPDNILRGSGCPKCSGLLRKTTEEFKTEVYKLVKSEYSVLGEYKNNHTKILMQHNCKNCNNYNFEMTPLDFIARRARCPRCSGRYKTDKEFKSQIYNLVGNEYTVLGKYEKSNLKILMRHNICGYEWNVAVGNFLQGSRCPNCNKSKGEKRIEDYLKINNFIKDRDYMPQKEFDGLIGENSGNLSYDFYLPIHNLLIEYQGEQHEKPVDFYSEGLEKTKERFKKQQEHDRRKREYANQHNINLLEIWYYDFDSIENILNKELSITV